MTVICLKKFENRSFTGMCKTSWEHTSRPFSKNTIFGMALLVKSIFAHLTTFMSESCTILFTMKYPLSVRIVPKTKHCLELEIIFDAYLKSTRNFRIQLFPKKFTGLAGKQLSQNKNNWNIPLSKQLHNWIFCKSVPVVYTSDSELTRTHIGNFESNKFSEGLDCDFYKSAGNLQQWIDYLFCFCRNREKIRCWTLAAGSPAHRFEI